MWCDGMKPSHVHLQIQTSYYGMWISWAIQICDDDVECNGGLIVFEDICANFFGVFVVWLSIFWHKFQQLISLKIF